MKKAVSFNIKVIQTDNGLEIEKYFDKNTQDDKNELF